VHEASAKSVFNVCAVGVVAEAAEEQDSGLSFPGNATLGNGGDAVGYFIDHFASAALDEDSESGNCAFSEFGKVPIILVGDEHETHDFGEDLVLCVHDKVGDLLSVLFVDSVVNVLGPFEVLGADGFPEVEGAEGDFVSELHVRDGELGDEGEVVVGGDVAVLAEVVHDLVDAFPVDLVVHEGHQQLEGLVAVLDVLQQGAQELDAVPDGLQRIRNDLILLLQAHQQTAQNLLARLQVDVRLDYFQLLADEAQGDDRGSADVVVGVFGVLG
jgi:hypothetical protein